MAAFSLISNSDADASRLISGWANAIDQKESLQRRRKNSQLNFLLGRALLRSQLFFMTGERNWVFSADPGGRLLACSQIGSPAPHISLSHTNKAVAGAVSFEGPVGIDVEEWKPRDFALLSLIAFGPSESNAATENGASSFYRMWTFREALGKARGEGIFTSQFGCDLPAGPDGLEPAAQRPFTHYEYADGQRSLCVVLLAAERKLGSAFRKIALTSLI